MSEKGFGQRGVHRAPAREVRDALHGFEEDGWKVFVLPDGINDYGSFRVAATDLFPLDPPWHGVSWDALADCLWDGLYELPEHRIAILWPDAITLADSDRMTYGDVLSVLAQVSRQLADTKATVGKPKDVLVLVGE